MNQTRNNRKIPELVKLGTVLALPFILTACLSAPLQPASGEKPANANLPTASSTVAQAAANLEACPGDNALPSEFAAFFNEIEDPALLSQAVMPATKGGLCQAKVYQSKQALTIYRAWNSNNPGSRLGSWWAFFRAEGKVSQYRKDYEICTQFSPLDKLTQCKLNAGSVVVVGTGQSASCDAYLTYPTSAAKQIYMAKDVAKNVVAECQDFDAVFDWKPSQP